LIDCLHVEGSINNLYHLATIIFLRSFPESYRISNMAKKKSRNDNRVAILARVPVEVRRKLQTKADQEQRSLGSVVAILLTQATATLP